MRRRWNERRPAAFPAPAFAPRTAVPERCGRLFFSVCLRPGPAHPIDKGAIVMKCERIPLGAQGAYLDTYFLADSPELKAGACRRPLSYVRAAATPIPATARPNPSRWPCAPRLPRLCAALSLRARPFPRRAARAGRSRGLGARGRRGEPCGPAANLRMRFFCGRHLAGSLGVFWNAPFLAAETGLAPQDMRPDKMVLCYPVITGGEFAHKGSFDNLLGADADAARRAEVSLEQHVTQDTPPAFLWHHLYRSRRTRGKHDAVRHGPAPCGRTV